MRLLHRLIVLASCACIVRVVKTETLETTKKTMFYGGDNDHLYASYAAMYNNSKVIVSLSCNSTKGMPLGKVEATVFVRYTPCLEEYTVIKKGDELDMYFKNPMSRPISLQYDYVRYYYSKPHKCVCDGTPCSSLLDGDPSNQILQYKECYYTKNNTNNQCKMWKMEFAESLKKSQSEKNTETDDDKGKTENEHAKEKKTKRAIDEGKTKMAGEATTEKAIETTVKKEPEKPINKPISETGRPTSKPENANKEPVNGMKSEHAVGSVWEDGMFLVVLKVRKVQTLQHWKLQTDAQITLKADYGYLPATLYPMLIFYGVMCIIYLLYGLVWIIVCARQWRELVRIQFWIGAVIVLGMLEKAVFYTCYQHMNSTGNHVKFAFLLAEGVSCLKRTLARMLVIIVSLGFGIVKPRLGPMLHKVVGMGALYFIMATVESCLRTLKETEGPNYSKVYLATIPLGVLDAAICYWIFSSLVQTMRTLRLRRNLVKLSLYRHFTNSLIFAVFVSVVFMIWSIKELKVDCLKDWKEMWVDDAFWHMLFAIILMIIMVLWRPSANNQRYAFTPLLDAADDEDEEDEPVIYEAASEGIKMRSKSNGKSPTERADPSRKIEEELKWVEENVPNSVAIPGLLDESDDEIMTSKFELSKLQ